jgi:hypothetical protein
MIPHDARTPSINAAMIFATIRLVARVSGTGTLTGTA